MSRRRRTRMLLPLLLLTTCAVVSTRLYDEWHRLPLVVGSDATAAAGVEGGAETLSAAEVALALPPPEQFAVIEQRPLFAQTRRPPPAPAAQPEALEPPPEPEIVEAPPPPPPEPPPTLEFTLVGIVTAGVDRYALLQRAGDGEVIEITEGGDIAGWFAVLIDPDRAVFRQRGTEEELVLHYDAAVPPEMIPPPRAKASPPGTLPAEDAPANGTAPTQ